MKTPVLESLLNKVTGLRPSCLQPYQKRDSNTGVNILKTTFLYNTTGGCFWNKYIPSKIHSTHRTSGPEVFCKNGALKNFAKSTKKHMRQRLFFNKVAG